LLDQVERTRLNKLAILPEDSDGPYKLTVWEEPYRTGPGSKRIGGFPMEEAYQAVLLQDE
jgi:hypothetical protein